MTIHRIHLVFLIVLVVTACTRNNSTNSDKEHNTKKDVSQLTAESVLGWRFDTGTDINQLFNCLEEADLTLISAHRAGAYPNYPENALETAQYISSKIPALHEIDVATSKDGVLFLMHDDTLDRTTTGTGIAHEQDWDKIRILKLKDINGRTTAFSPPTLAAFLSWAKGRALVQIDFKRSTRFEDVVGLVKQKKATPYVIYIAYNLAQAQKLHRLHPEAMISVSINSMSELNRLVASGIPTDKMIAFTGIEEPRPRLFNILNQRDVEVIFGTLGGRNSIDREIEENGNDIFYTNLSLQGVDILATDRPLQAYATLTKNDRTVNKTACSISRQEIP